MKTKKSFSEWLSLIVTSLLIVSAIAALVLLTINHEFFSGSNETLTIFSSIALLVILTPGLLLQFAAFAGLLDDTDGYFSFWAKLFFYLLLFPLFNLGAVIAVNGIFQFLPNIIEAMAQGVSPLIVATMRKELLSQLLVISGITYVSITGAGFLYKVIRQKKSKKIKKN